MAKFQLTISTNYCANWGAWEGIRELVQNGLDGQDDGAELKVSHHGTTFRVSNTGVRLDPKVWLMGTSSKGSGQYRGHFGEGLKLGVLALVRAGHEVKIVNGDESWTPKLEPSEVFGGDEVLTVYTHKRQNDSGAFTVEVGGVSKEAWDLMKARFLFLAKPKQAVETSYARVLLDDDMRGKVFVKGIFVQNSPDLAAGYDFKRADVDRDRRMVSSWDLRYNAAKAWEEAMTQAPETHAAKVLDLLQSSSPDVVNMSEGFVAPEAASTVAKVFRDRHGDKSIPVASMAAAREAEHYGFKGVVVQAPLMAVLKNESTLNLDKLREDYKNSAQKSYGWSDLTAEEQAVYSDALALVQGAATELGYGTIEDRLTIVDFGDANLDGTFKGGKIEIAKRLLSDPEEFLITLVHEVAHAQGADGSVSHERAEGKLYARIISRQRQH